MARYFFPRPQSAAAAIGRLPGLTNAQLKQLQDFLREAPAFEAPSDQLEALSEHLGGAISSRELRDLLAVLGFLYEQRHDSERPEGDAADVVADFAEAFEFEASTVPSLLELTEKAPQIERHRKLRWLRTGIVDTGIKFSSFVELRPRFDEERTKLLEYVPTIIIEVVTDSEHDRQRSHVFQVSPDGLDRLRSMVEDATKKLDLMIEGAPKGAPVVTAKPKGG